MLGEGDKMRLLLDTDLQKMLPKLYDQEHNELKVLYARYYHPEFNYEWYAMEYSSIQRLFFGLVEGEDLEYGYFTLDELERIGAKRDYYFTPKVLKQGVDYGKRAV